MLINSWQLLTTLGNPWQLLATLGNSWQLLATLGYSWQLNLCFRNHFSTNWIGIRIAAHNEPDNDHRHNVHTHGGVECKVDPQTKGGLP